MDNAKDVYEEKRLMGPLDGLTTKVLTKNI